MLHTTLFTGTLSLKMKLRHKTALITGGAVRIGQAVCRALAAEGVNIIIHCHQSVDEANILQAEIEQGGGRAWVIAADLQQPEGCRHLIQSAVDVTGWLDVLINNAAVFLPDDIATLKPDTLEQQLRVNLLAPMYLTQEFAKQIKDNGCIINMLDRRICEDDPHYLSYTLSKKGLADLTRSSARDLAPAITVNGIALGAVLPPQKQDGDTRTIPAGSAPLAAVCSLRDVTDTVLFLIRSDVITGQIIYVDAGQHLSGNLKYG